MRRLCVGGLIGFMIGCALSIFFSADFSILALSAVLGAFIAWLCETAPEPQSRRAYYEEEFRKSWRNLQQELVSVSEKIRDQPKPTVFRPRPEWPPKPSDN
ncbi:MAG: hypothetical protein G01um101419_551 [Parcubacteria group bacterium Gr01-1014_19]|nr:MAG: hypothetical protein G01um101419_551 [Parcubacteria group bacterium Gr01-1014_19]